MKIPILNFKGSKKLGNKYSKDQQSNVLKKWLFDGLPTRTIDSEILGLDAKKSKGFQSMSILHFFGLKKEFQGIFKEQTTAQAIEFIKEDSQNFDEVIELLNLDRDNNYNSKNNKKDDDHPETHNEPIIEEIITDGLDRFIHKDDLEDLIDSEGTDGLGSAVIKYRKEQGQLRISMFGTKKEEACALCHKIYPVEFLWVSHIKPRSDCTEDERLDKNIAMPACKFGCDDMFEKGYILVDEVGNIIKNENKYLTSDLNQKILEVIGKKCKSFNNNTSKYFDFRRKVFKNEEPQKSNMLKDAYSETSKK